MKETITGIKYGAILLFAAGGVWLGAVRPAYKERGRVLGEIAALEQRVAQADDDHAFRLSARQRLDTIESRLRNETRLIPESSDVAGVITGISSDIRELELGSAKLTRGRESALGSTASSGLVLETTGRFDVIVDLLRRIEALPRLVRISSLTAKNVNHPTGEVNATISLDAYYRIAAAESSQAVKP